MLTATTIHKIKSSLLVIDYLYNNLHIEKRL